MKADITFDLIMTDSMSFAEGAFRLPGEDWQVFVFSRYDIARPLIEISRWGSGVTGVFVRFPASQPLNKAACGGIRISAKPSLILEGGNNAASIIHR